MGHPGQYLGVADPDLNVGSLKLNLPCTFLQTLGILNDLSDQDVR
jgi:hypothetical protein